MKTQAPETGSSATLDEARQILEAGRRRADEIGQPMNIAVVCSGGHLLAFERMPNAWIGSVDIAIKKAWTSRAFDVETAELAKLAQSGEQFFGIHASNDGKVMIFAGGVPLMRDGKIIGAVGVSGGTGKQDQAVAEAAASIVS